MPRALLGLVLLLTAGCSTAALPAWFPFTWRSEDERTARRPSGEAREGEAKTARGAPDRSGRERPDDPAEALYRFGLLQADPTSGIRDYRAASDLHPAAERVPAQPLGGRGPCVASYAHRPPRS